MHFTCFSFIYQLNRYSNNSENLQIYNSCSHPASCPYDRGPVPHLTQSKLQG
uniref:Uncharacterized protein n=1 Tax=Arundo donax TaxID=35708 RepID=A0A0A9AF25_ARUDO